MNTHPVDKLARSGACLFAHGGWVGDKKRQCGRDQVRCIGLLYFTLRYPFNRSCWLVERLGERQGKRERERDGILIFASVARCRKNDVGVGGEGREREREMGYLSLRLLRVAGRMM